MPKHHYLAVMLITMQLYRTIILLYCTFFAKYEYLNPGWVAEDNAYSNY